MRFVWQLIKLFSLLTVNERFTRNIWTVCTKQAESPLLRLCIDETDDVSELRRCFVFGFHNIKHILFVLNQLVKLLWPEFYVWCTCDEISLNKKLFALAFNIFIGRLRFLLYFANLFRLRLGLLFEIGSRRFSFWFFYCCLYRFFFDWIQYVASLAFSDIA